MLKTEVPSFSHTSIPTNRPGIV